MAEGFIIILTALKYMAEGFMFFLTAMKYIAEGFILYTLSICLLSSLQKYLSEFFMFLHLPKENLYLQTVIPDL
jgi:hypothetical protein